jgi:glycosyltransferase involved in cell wall biosynthesis
LRIALDAQLTVGTATGIGEYVRGLVPALIANGVDVAALCDASLDPWRFDRRFAWDQVLLPRRAARSGAALLHCTSGTMPLRCVLPIVATVHDVAWLRVQQHARWYARAYFGRFSLARYRAARALLADSEFSRAELLALQPSLDPARVHVVAPGVDAAYADVQRHPDGRTMLVVGTVERRKNLAHAVALLAHAADARLVSVGPLTPYADECKALARRLGVEGRVELRGYVSRDALLELYAHAAVVVVPSTYEGFGYAVAQALCAGVPCVTSDRTSLPEVAGGDARVVALDDERGWVEALGEALAGRRDADAAAARERSVARFGWQNAAQRVARVYRAAIDQ